MDIRRNQIRQILEKRGFYSNTKIRRDLFYSVNSFRFKVVLIRNG